MDFEGLNLEWLGHAGFLISGSKVVYIDPYQISINEPKADFIFITHPHYDHCSLEDIAKVVKDGSVVVVPADVQSKISRIDKRIDLKIIEPGQEQEVERVKVKAVAAYNIDKPFHGKAEYWNGYIIDIDGKKIYHAGDTDLIPEISEISGIDVALFPIGGTYTMDATQASQAALMIKPKLAVPMHYGDVVGSKEDAERFKELCEQEGVSVEVLEKK